MAKLGQKRILFSGIAYGVYIKSKTTTVGLSPQILNENNTSSINQSILF